MAKTTSVTCPSATADHDAVLRVQGLDFSYGQLQVLFGVSLEVRRGEALALVGTNGAGKSTLLRVVCGLERPNAGSIRFDGRDITGVRAERLAAEGLVLVPGGRAVFTDMTVAENLEMQALAIRRDPKLLRERRELVFTTFPRLRERLYQRAGTLSGGEQQQLALAKAMLLAPKLLLIDELSLGLAPVVVAELLQVVRRLNLDGTSVVLVEQSLNVAARLCDRAVFLEKGQVRFDGRTSDLLERDDIARAVFFGTSEVTGNGTTRRRRSRT
jgi:ABC-type branched-subunit amino acid transport system ATPase component